ncbi:MAG TPA: IclR family transcriptional regulator [Rhizomicrobium sp.]
MLWNGEDTRIAGPADTSAALASHNKKNNLVWKSFSILCAFRHPHECLTSHELSRRANLPKASCHRLVQTLEEVGAIVRGASGRYRLGMLLSCLSQNVAVKELLREVGRPLLLDLAIRLDMTIHLGMLENGMVDYLSKVATPTSFASHTRSGARLEAYCSGLGKVLLAALQEDELESFILEGELVALTPHTITDRSALLQELVKVRRQGFAVDDCEARIDTRCVAVPVRDLSDKVISAISATGNAQTVTSDQIPFIHRELLRTAGLFSEKLFDGARR